MSPHGKADLHGGSHPIIMAPPIQADLCIQALENLRDMHRRGLLLPVAGAGVPDGTVLDVYIDILGLNNRVLRSSVKER